MQKIRIFILGLAVVTVTGTVGVAVASAHKFTSEKAPATLTGHQGTQASTTGNQVFTSAPGSEVVCKTASTSGEIKAQEYVVEQEVVVKYEKCTAFGFIGATISPADYNISAEGSVVIQKPITITVSGTCTVTVSEQTVGSVSFKNEAPGIEQSSNVTGIHSTTTNSSLCPAGSEGTYSGNNYISSPENTIEWV